MKKILIACSILIVLATGVFYYLKSKRLTDFEPLMKQKLQQLVKDGSRGLYDISIGKVDIDVLQSKVIFADIHLHYDTSVYIQRVQLQQQPKDLFDIKVKAISIDGITPVDILRKKDLRLNVLYINNPVIKIYHTPGEDAFKDSTTLYHRITKEIGSFGIKKFALKNANVSFVNTKTKVEEHFPELHITLDDFLIDDSTQNDSSRFLYSKDASIAVMKYRRRTNDNLYTLKLDSVLIQASKKEVSIKKFQFTPNVSKAELRKILKARKDRYDIDINNIMISNIDWWGVVTNDVVNIGDVLIKDGKTEIYCDKTIPVKQRNGILYPHQKLFELNMPFRIDKIKIKNLDFTYAEFNEESLKEGKIIFQNTDAVITNITNIPSVIAKNPFLKIDATSSFMKTAALNAGFTFNLAKQKDGVFSVYANLGGLDGTLLNPVTEPLTMVKINKANITGYRMTMHGDINDARADVLLTYHDLDITVLKKDDNGKMKKQGFMSFIVNTFKINGDAPKKGKAPVTYEGNVVRRKQKTFFSLVWKTMLEGIKKTVGI